MVVLFSSRPTTVLLFGTTNWTPYAETLYAEYIEGKMSYMEITLEIRK